MPTTPITKDFTHPTCRISVEGKTLTPDRIAELTSPVSCTIRLDVSGSSHTFEGDGETLHDLVTTINRYLNYLLSSQSQGTFSGSVAIRPLDAVRHRITLKQGNGVGQADLSTTQLYDLAESLGEIDDAIPQLARLKTRPKTVEWYRRPAASVAALAVVGLGVVAASVVLTRPTTQNLGDAEYRLDESVSQLEESPIDSTDGGDPGGPDSSAPLQAPAAPISPATSEPNESSVSPDEAESPSQETGLLEGINGESSAAIPSDIGSGEIGSNVEIANADSDDVAARSFALSDAERERDAATDRPSQQLGRSLGDSWQAPETLTEPVEYDLTIAEDETILTAVPVDERAAEFQAQTPFADLPETSDLDGILVRVTLAPDSTVTVTTPSQPASPQPQD